MKTGHRLFTPVLILVATCVLGLGIFGPCVKILPGFGDYSPVVRMLKPDLTHPTHFSLFRGVLQLADGGAWLLAVVVFGFSVVFPVAKLTVFWIAAIDSPKHPGFKAAVRTAHVLGKFSMVDVFVIALLVIAIKGLPGNTQVQLQWGFWCFCAAIVMSLIVPYLLRED